MSWRLEELLDPSHPTSKLWRRMRDERRAAVLSQSHQKLLIPAPKHSDVEEARLFGGKLSTPSIINRQHLFRVDNYPVQLTIFVVNRIYSVHILSQIFVNQLLRYRTMATPIVNASSNSVHGGAAGSIPTDGTGLFHYIMFVELVSLTEDIQVL